MITQKEIKSDHINNKRTRGQNSDDKRFQFLIERLIGPMVSKDPLTRRQDLSPMVDYITQKPIKMVIDEIDNLIESAHVLKDEYIEPDIFKSERDI